MLPGQPAGGLHQVATRRRAAGAQARPPRCSSPDERVRQLKDVGDTSLYVSGFFADSLQRKLVDVDYYIQMGGAAYASWRASSAATRNSAVFGEVYDELGTKFPRFVDVFAEVSRGAR